MEAAGTVGPSRGRVDFFGEEFLIGALLQALTKSGDVPPVLLIDELDRADAGVRRLPARVARRFSDYRPGAEPFARRSADRHHHVQSHARAQRRPEAAIVYYFWIDYLRFDKELRIVTTRARRVGPAREAGQPRLLQELRTTDLYKAAGVSRRSTGSRPSSPLQSHGTRSATIELTLGILLKSQDDIVSIRGERILSC